MALSQPRNASSWRLRVVTSIGRKFRSDKAYTEEVLQVQRKAETAKLRKKSLAQDANPAGWEVNELGERNYAAFGDETTLAESRTTRDHGDMMHRLAHHDSFDSLLDKVHAEQQASDLYTSSHQHGAPVTFSAIHELRVASLPNEVWNRISSFLDPLDAANLAIASRTLHGKLGLITLKELDRPENRNSKIAFLHQFDAMMPGYLLCFPCAKYHRRSRPGKETFRADFIKHPIFICPNVHSSVLPRMRLVHGREFPYAFVQLALRHARHSSNHGISHDVLSRRWRCRTSTWQHTSRYMIHNRRLLLRVKSQSFVPPSSSLTETAERHILYDREEYTPYFSVCVHWRDGDLMKVCKCMLSHVPAPPDSYFKQLTKSPTLSRSAAKPNFIVTGCDWCRPARRCPECPTEYLVEVQMLEDKDDKVQPFKHALVVTRWSDLGNGSNPHTSPEWAAINGLPGVGYDSFTIVGRRAVGGVFESKISGSNPGQRLVSLNPKKQKVDEDDCGWY